MFHENRRTWCLRKLPQIGDAVASGNPVRVANEKTVVVNYGLIYPSVNSVSRLNGVKPGRRKALLRKVQLIETGALEGFAERYG